MINYIILTNDEIKDLVADRPIGFKIRQTNGEVIGVVLVPESIEDCIKDNSIIDEIDFGEDVL